MHCVTCHHTSNYENAKITACSWASANRNNYGLWGVSCVGCKEISVGLIWGAKPWEYYNQILTAASKRVRI